MKISPLDRVDTRMAAVRRYALAEFGEASDATCFRIATTFWCAACDDGFHRAAPAEIPALELDDCEPVL